MSLERAYKLGCNTVQIFSHNPRGWQVKEISKSEALMFQSLRLSYDISPVFIHTSYLINLASSQDELRRKSVKLLIMEMDIADMLGAEYVILHTGSASADKAERARKRAIDSLKMLATEGSWNSRLLIENTAGEKGDISSTIPDIAEILNGISPALTAGVCIDTCHAFASGYDLRYMNDVRQMFNEIKEYIGMDKIKLIHLNDSKGDLGSRIDRHEHIGKGKIGLKGLEICLNFPFLKRIPIILETPKKTEYDDPANLSIVKKIMK